MDVPDSPGRAPARHFHPVARLLAAAALGALTLGSCRADSLSAPCTNEPGCQPAPGAAPAVEVLVALEDAELRLATPALAAPLAQLRLTLAGGDAAAARQALLVVYARLADATAMDAADRAAVRLAVYPAARTLGVAEPVVVSARGAEPAVAPGAP